MSQRNTYREDEELEEQINFRDILRVGKYLKPYMAQVARILVVVISMSCIVVAVPYLTKIMIDEAIPNKDLGELGILAVILAALIVLYEFGLRYRTVAITRVGQLMLKDMRRDIFTHIQTLPFSYFDSRPHGKILIRVVNYVNSVSDMLSNGLINIVLESFNLLFIVIFMFLVDVQMAFVVLCGVPVLCVFMVWIKNKQRRAWKAVSNKNSNLNAYLQENIVGARITQIFAREDENAEIFKDLSKDCRRTWNTAVRYSNLVWPGIDSISVCVRAAIFLSGLILFGQGNKSVGTIVAISSYASYFWQPIMNLGNIFNNFINNIAYLERIFETMDEPVTVKDAKDAVEMPKIRGEVTFDHVNFSYDASKQILNDVSFTVKPGESVALVGPTGAGKSTSVNLISRFYNVNGGRVLIDGQDISQVTIHSLREQMGIMMQDSFIFSGDIEDNIRYGKLDATHEEIVKASRTVCADEFISKMPDRYQTEVRERGSMLSQGQKQLISFARTLLSDPAILILDEATSSIDVQTEKALQTGLNAMLKGRTSFIIAHRLSTIRNCDKIMYIDNGGIMESGTHDELMAKKGHYYKLYTAQLDEVQKAG